VRWTLDPIPLVLLIAAGGLYLRAIRTLTRRGQRIPSWQQVAWWAGLGLMGLALMGPASGYVDRLLVAHMAEHLLIADIAAPLVLAGLRTPVLQHFLPPALMRPLSRSRGLRRFGHVISRAPVAIAIYLLVLYAWHFSFAFEAALRSPWVHALQHQSFIAISMLVWWSALEPGRRRLPGQLWKIGYIFAMRMVSLFLGMALIFSHSPWYAGYYGNRAREYGLTPLEDQQLAGGMMMSLDIVIIMFALCLFFWRSASDHDREEAASAGPDARPHPSSLRSSP
jgi:cytochrome c oxidase assembly factor CtaG